MDQSAESLKAKPSLAGYIFARVQLQPIEEPHIVCLSDAALKLIDLDLTYDNQGEDATTAYLAGNVPIEGSSVQYTHCYAGYQFGFFSGQLGDGAATTLGEVLTASGDRIELQLKGAGRTPFSRCGLMLTQVFVTPAWVLPAYRPVLGLLGMDFSDLLTCVWLLQARRRA